MVGLNKALGIGAIGVLAVVAIAGTVYGSVYFTGRQSGELAREEARCRVGQHSIHKVLIENDEASPSHTTATLCDKLIITNLDGVDRLVAFGPHEDHQAYDGITERILGQGQSLTVTLVRAGNFRFHDHTHDEVQGTFTVTGAD